MPEGRTRVYVVVGALALLAAGVAVALVLLIDGGGSAPSETLSRQQFLARGDRICRDAHRQFADLQRNQPATAADAEDLTQALLETAEHERNSLATLAAPHDLEQRVSEYLKAREQGIAELRKGLDAAERGDGDAYLTAQADLARGQLARERLARRIGLRECSAPIGSRAQLAEDAKPPTSESLNAPPTIKNPPTGTP
jgi:hypothetical protein